MDMSRAHPFYFSLWDIPCWMHFDLSANLLLHKTCWNLRDIRNMCCIYTIYKVCISAGLLAFCFICIFMNLIANAAAAAFAGVSCASKCHRDKCTNCQTDCSLSVFVAVAEYFNLADFQVSGARVDLPQISQIFVQFP